MIRDNSKSLDSGGKTKELCFIFWKQVKLNSFNRFLRDLKVLKTRSKPKK